MTNTRANPYVGPRSFNADETLYGRTGELRMLTAQLISERVVLLHSPSGAGKTSLIRAGLIPILRKENFNILPIARVNLEPEKEIVTTKGFNRYAYSVITALEEGLPIEQRRPLTELAGQDLDTYLANRPRPDGAPRSDMLIFDQFEEVLTIAPTDLQAKEDFFLQLGEALSAPNRWALFAIREDYIGALAPYVLPLPNRFEATFRLDLLGIDAAKQAIQSPARALKVEFSEDAANKLVDDLRHVQVQQPDGSSKDVLGEYIEPVQLQVVCYRLWQSLSPTDDFIDLDDLKAVGDVDQSLGEYYAMTVANAAEKTGLSERYLRQWFESKLISKEGIRVQVLRGPEASDGLDNRAVKLLEDAYIIRGEKRSRFTWLELSHDRLIQPVRKNNAAWFETHLNLFQKQAVSWSQQGRGEGLLLRDKEFDQVEKEVSQLSLTENEAAFLAACRKLRSQERLRRRLVIGLAAMFAISIIALFVSLWAYNQSAARSAVTEGRVALVNNNPHLAAALALRAGQIADIPEARDLLAEAAGQVDSIGNRAFMGHFDSVSSVARSADGRLASGSWDDRVIVWDEKNGKPAQVLQGHTDAVSSVAWSANGRLASGSDDGTVIIWNLQTGRPDQVLEGHSQEVDGVLEAVAVNSIAWSPDGQLAAGLADGAIILWDAQTEQPAQTLQWRDAVHAIAWSAEGQLASGSSDGAVIIWDLASRGPGQTLVGHTAGVNSLAWSVYGPLASASSDGSVILWDLEVNAPALTLKGHTADVNGVAWSAEGQLASASSDGSVMVWDMDIGRPIRTLRGHSDDVYSVVWVEGDRLASGGSEGAVIFWDLNAVQPARVLVGHANMVSSVAWSPDGELASGSKSGEVILWNLLSREPILTLEGYYFGVNSLAWSADGRLASGGDVGEVIIWDLASGEVDQVLEGHTKAVSSVAWSADGQLASGSVDGSVIVWNPEKGQPEHILRGHSIQVSGVTKESPVRSVAWSPDGQLASGGADGKVILWDLEKGEPAEILEGHRVQQRFGSRGKVLGVTTLAWAPDGRLASGGDDGRVLIWDLRPPVTNSALPAHSKGISSVAWMDDGRLASASADGTITIWDTSLNKPIHSQKGKIATSVAWAPDGLLAVGLEDSTVNLLDTSFIAPPCDWLLRNLTIRDWENRLGRLYPYRPVCDNLPQDTVSSPSWSEWRKILGSGVDVFSDLSYPPARFLWLTSTGRALVLVLLALVLFGSSIAIRMVQKRSARWVKGFLWGGGLLLIVSIFSNNLLMMIASLALSIGAIGLAARLIARHASWPEIAITIGFAVSFVALLFYSPYSNLDLREVPIADLFFSVFLLGLSISFFGLALWLAYRGSRRVLRRLRRKKALAAIA